MRAAGLRLVVLTLVSAIVAGVALDGLTFLVARYGLQGADGASWSLRGNGALVVPFGLGPAILAGAWSALVLHARGARHWLRGGAIAGTIGAAFVGASILALILFNAAGLRLSELLVYPTWLWVATAPLIAAIVPVHGNAEAPRRWLIHLLLVVLFPVAMAVSFLAAEVVLSPGS